MDADGDFVVAWESDSQDSDASGWGIFAQRYAADGTPQGAEFRVNTYTTNDQRFPSAAMDADGDFVVAWTSVGQDGSSFGVFAQRFAADGTPQGPEFQVNTYTTSFQSGASVAMDADGDFVVAWTSFDQDGVRDGVFAQRFATDGTPQGPEFLVNTYTPDNQLLPSVAMDATGDFVTAWQGNSPDGDVIGVFAQRFGADGTPQGPEFLASTYTTSSQTEPSAAMDADGDFVIVWQGDSRDGDGVFAQRFAADGTLQGPEFQVNTYTTGDQLLPSVAMDAEGNFVVAWMSGSLGDTQDGDSFGVFAQRFGADGTPQGSEFQANTYTTSRQGFPSVAMDAGGDFVVTWESYGQDGESLGIYAQRFSASPVANEDDAPLPTTLALDAVFPNPVRDAATLRYALPTTAAVRLSVTDVLGRTVLARAEGVQPAGEHEARLALGDLPSGVYVVRLDANGTTVTQRVSVVR
ncbi:MAG: T9SS type A sorting domain-containing protein [Bacteroidota bacterium]